MIASSADLYDHHHHVYSDQLISVRVLQASNKDQTSFRAAANVAVQSIVNRDEIENHLPQLYLFWKVFA